MPTRHELLDRLPTSARRPLTRALHGPFDGLFSARFSAARTLCESIAAVISASPVYCFKTIPPIFRFVKRQISQSADLFPWANMAYILCTQNKKPSIRVGKAAMKYWIFGCQRDFFDSLEPPGGYAGRLLLSPYLNVL